LIDVDVFIAFYTCTEGSKIHRHLLERCIESARREEVRNVYVIDGSRSALLKKGEFDAELIRNEKHSLACTINIAIETAREDFLLLSTGSILGVGSVNNMVAEKREIEKEHSKPAAIVARGTGYPTHDPWLLECPMAGTIETVKKELRDLGYSYTNEGIAIADEPRTDWSEKALMGDLRVRRLGGPSTAYSARGLATECLVNKDRFFDIGGCDERCYCIDYGTGMRWISFGWPLFTSDSALIHRINATTNKICKERELDRFGTFCHYCGYDLKDLNVTGCPICKKEFTYTEAGHHPPCKPASFREWMKYEKPLLELFQHHAYAKPIKDNPSLYREWLRPVYREEYDRLREKPFFMGRE